MIVGSCCIYAMSCSRRRRRRSCHHHYNQRNIMQSGTILTIQFRWSTAETPRLDALWRYFRDVSGNLFCDSQSAGTTFTFHKNILCPTMSTMPPQAFEKLTVLEPIFLTTDTAIKFAIHELEAAINDLNFDILIDYIVSRPLLLAFLMCGQWHPSSPWSGSHHPYSYTHRICLELQDNEELSNIACSIPQFALSQGPIVFVTVYVISAFHASG